MKYTVIGVYADDPTQRYAATVEAESPQAAELAAVKQCYKDNGWEDWEVSEPQDYLFIAGVAEGEVRLADMEAT